MFAGCLQIMWAHSHLIRAGGVGYSQIIRAENADVCRSYGLCLQAATVSPNSSPAFLKTRLTDTRLTGLSLARLLWT